MGKVFYDLGFLATAEVIECSATEFVGQYVGQTGPRTQRLLEKGLGKVLFIDEAYRLAEGHFAKEAMDEIVDSITKPKFAQKLIIILAGYEADINRLMSINPGLTSRFPETVLFKGLDPDECARLLIAILQGQKRRLLVKRVGLDMTILESPRDTFLQNLVERFKTVSRLPNWANARDVETIAKSIFGKILNSTRTSPERLTLDEKTVEAVIDAMIAERVGRSRSILPNQHRLSSASLSPIQERYEDPPTVKQNQPAQSMSSATPGPPSPVITHVTQERSDDTLRDANVSDEVWESLQQDKAAAKTKEDEYKRLLEQQLELQSSAAAAAKRVIETTINVSPEEEVQADADAEAKRRHEEARLRYELERRAREAEIETLRRKRQAQEELRRKEREAQKKLREMGVCCAGFRWIKQGLGYRCAGGSHYVSDAELGLV